MKNEIFWLCFFIVLGLTLGIQPALGQDLTPAYTVGFRAVDLDYPESKRETKLTVAVWYPSTDKPEQFIYGGPTAGMVVVNGEPVKNPEQFPLLIFSHGYGGFGFSAVFLTEHLAAQGWVVVAPDHHDPHFTGRIRTGRNKKFDRSGFLQHAKQIGSSSPADRKKYVYRLNEIQCALNRILKHPVFGPLIDKDKIVLGGHSFGGYTVLGLCGTIPQRHEPRIKAVLLFSTGAGGYLYTAEELSKVRIPTMLFMGERERNKKRGDKTMLEIQKKIFLNISAPKYFLEVKRASHFSFNNQLFSTIGSWILSGNKKTFTVIRRYSIAFLEKYGAGKSHLDQVLDKKDPMLQFLIEAEPLIKDIGK